MELKKFQEYIEAFLAYYSFVLLAYAATLYVAHHTHLFWWVFLVSTSLLTGLLGYQIKLFLDLNNQRHGVKIISDVMTYEIGPSHKFTLRYLTKIKAVSNHLIVFPIGHQWTGDKDEATPVVSGDHQHLVGVIQSNNHNKKTIKVIPYTWTVSREGEWQYWFVALDPPLQKGDSTEIKYSQEFNDKSLAAKPTLYYFVRTPMKRVELNVKFPENKLPKNVTGSIIRPNHPNRPHKVEGVNYDPHKQWATWIINKPKTGYCYRIDWH